MTFFFHFVMWIIVGGILTVYYRRPRVGVWAAAASVGAVAAVLTAVLIKDEFFDLARYLSLAIFIYAPLTLLGTAAISGRKNILWTLGTAFVALVLWGVAVDAFWIEPVWLEVTHHQIASGKIRRPVRIVVIADPQMDSFGDYERKALDSALGEKPDLLLWAGDYLQALPAEQDRVIAGMREYLLEKNPDLPLGAYAVQGNTDPRQWPELFTGTKIRPIFSRQTFAWESLTLTCLSLGESFSTFLEVPNPDPEKFHIVLGHVPNFAFGKVEADLMIAGHTHGGQVRLPGVGPLVTNARVPRKWAAGLTDLPDGGKLFVSRGIGMERISAPRLRFLCRPEVAVIDLIPRE